MKKILNTTLLLLVISLTSVASNNKQTITSKANDVTVFLRGAQVNRTTTKAYVNTGTTELIVKNLSPNIDNNSIQVSGECNCTILSVTNNRNYLKNSEKSKEIVVLEDSIKYLNKVLDNSRAQSSVYKDEKSMILTVSKLGEKSASEIEAIANLYRTRLLDLNKKILKSTKKEKGYSVRLTKIQQQLNALNASRNKPTSDLVITVISKQKSQATFNISYYVPNASWNPAYEIRAKDSNSPIDLRYKANVRQNSGEEWKDILLTLSTGNPSRNNSQPRLNPWRLNFKQNYNRARVVRKKNYGGAQVLSATFEAASDEAMTSANFTTVAQGDIATEFKIDLKQTLTSSNKNIVVELQQYNLNAEYTFYAAPKIDKDAFLLAKVTGWEEYNLLSGNAIIFYKGTYVGKSYINTQNSNDTLILSLGREKDIKIERIKLKDFTKKRTIGTNKKESFAWEIKIRNNKNKKINLVLEDQIPISSNNDIIVEVDNTSNGKVNNPTGLVTWNIKLGASDSKKLKVVYSVKYPANKTVSNL